MHLIFHFTLRRWDCNVIVDFRKNVVAIFESDILRLKSNGVPFWERGPLGNLMLCNDLFLSWTLILTCAKDGPPKSHLGWGSYHSMIFETNDLSFHNQFCIFKSSQIIFIMSRNYMPSLGVIGCDLDTLLVGRWFVSFDVVVLTVSVKRLFLFVSLFHSFYHFHAKPCPNPCFHMLKYRKHNLSFRSSYLSI